MSITLKNEFADTSDGKGQFSVSFIGQNIERGVNTKAIGSIRVMTANPDDFTDPAAVIVELDQGNSNMSYALAKLQEAGFRIGKNGNTAIKEFNDINRLPTTPAQHGQLFGAAIQALGILRSERAISPEDSAKALGALSKEFMTSLPQRLVDDDPRGKNDIESYVNHTPIGQRTEQDQYRFHLSMSDNASGAVVKVNDDAHGPNITSLRVKPDLLLPTMELLKGKGIAVERVHSEESTGFALEERKIYLNAAAPIRDVTAALADVGLIPEAALKKLEERLAAPVPEVPRNLPSGEMPGGNRRDNVTAERTAPNTGSRNLP